MPEEEVEVEAGTGVTVAPGNFVTVVDFSCGGFTVPGKTFLANCGCADLALNATVF